MILPPTSKIGHHHEVTNITISPTSLSPSAGESIFWLHSDAIWFFPEITLKNSVRKSKYPFPIKNDHFITKNLKKNLPKP